MFMSMKVGGLVCLMLTSGMAKAQLVEISPRPQARPSVQTLAMATPPVTSPIRPIARPSDLVGQKADILPVANTGFQNWITGFKARAQSQGIRRDVLDKAFRGVRYNTEVIAKDRNQSEFKKQIWDYLDNAVNPVRVANGQTALRKHGRVLRQIEARYGVDKEIVAAVWGLESTYGTRMGDMHLIESMATLAYDGRRGSFFEKQLIAALKIIQAGDVSPNRMTGSWAGAMGHTQFMPTSYLAYAVDFTGDGKRDIWSNNPTDALASTAAYLARFGWKKGQPWGVEVRLPRGFSASQASSKIRKMPSDWAAMGVLDMQGKPVANYGAASVLLPAGTQGVAFLVFDNFKVIKRYNNSDAYAIGVGHLGDRLKGKPAIQGSWPRGYAPLSFDQKKEMQRLLQRRGYKIEKIDGLIGPNTVNAIKAFQQARGVKTDGYPSQDVLRLLRR